MKDLNLKHLHYFWVVAHEGSIAAASEQLFVTPQTISAQLKALEARLKRQLFRRRGKSLGLTPAGETALKYADEIFDLRRELVAALSAEGDETRQMRIGVSDVVPKLIASSLLLPMIKHQPSPRLVCVEGEPNDLLAKLAQQKLDFVVADHAAAPDPNLRLYNHKLGSTGVSFMATPALAERLQGVFPACLVGQPMLMPGRGTALRIGLEAWLQQQGVLMEIAGEFDDSALTKAFGQLGAGVFCCPSAIENEVSRQYSVNPIGRTQEIIERFFLISRSKNISQPLIQSVVQRARTQVFI